MRRVGRILALSTAAVLIGCGGGGGKQQPAAGTPAQPLPTPPTGQQAPAAAATTAGSKAPAARPTARPAAQTPAAAGSTSTAAESSDVGLLRETFAYRPAGRDPFASLLKTGDVRPLPSDVRVSAILYDARYPQRSVATLKDTTTGKHYTVHVNDTVGRMRIRAIHNQEVVVLMEEFGVERQMVLPLRRKPEETQ